MPMDVGPKRVMWHHHNAPSAKAFFDSQASNMSTATTESYYLFVFTEEFKRRILVLQFHNFN